MRLSSPVAGVLAGACCAAVIACAAPRYATTAPAASGGAMLPSSQHADIDKLDHDIAAARDKLGLPAPAPALDLGSNATPLSVSPTSANDPACRPAKTDACTDTCTLADVICTDAAKICDLAQELSGDKWAADKCTSGEQSCDAAHARCCGCQ